jgi:20S proteasome subunit beta 7
MEILEAVARTGHLSEPLKHTKQPIVTGTSVLAVQYADGIMMAADTLGSYGSLAKYKDLRRVRAVGSSTLIGASGEYSDFQHIISMLNDANTADFCEDDGCFLGPDNIFHYMTRVLYQRRNKQNPLWNTLVVAGVKQDGEKFLGVVDNIATAFQDKFIATGYGEYIAMPLLRTGWEENMSEAKARALLETCMRTLYYRDCRTINRISFAKVTKDGPEVAEPISLETKWDYELFARPKAGADTDGSW